MATKRYTLVQFDEGDVLVVIHKVGCPKIKEDVKDGGSKELAKLDLEASDEEILDELDPAGEDIETFEQVELCDCTGYAPGETSPAPSPQPSTTAALASQQASRARLMRQVEETVEKLVAARGEDNIGEGDQWAGDRLATCTDDYVYDLAVEVRRLRGKGEPWWRVAYELGLPGSGASNRQGRKGSAFARRLWRAAWGKSYTGTTGTRESKARREERAMSNAGRPYFTEQATEMEVIDKITGQLIHWVARLNVPGGLVTSAQEAYVHDDPRLVKYHENGPQGPYVEFYEQVDPAQLLVDPRLSIAKSGPLRAVYVDRITRVGV